MIALTLDRRAVLTESLWLVWKCNAWGDFPLVTKEVWAFCQQVRQKGTAVLWHDQHHSSPLARLIQACDSHSSDGQRLNEAENGGPGWWWAHKHQGGGRWGERKHHRQTPESRWFVPTPISWAQHAWLASPRTKTGWSRPNQTNGD